MTVGGAAALHRHEVADDLVGVRGEAVQQRIGDRPPDAVARAAGQAAGGLEDDAGIGVLDQDREHCERLGQLGGDAADRGSGLASHALRRIVECELVEGAQVAGRAVAPGTARASLARGGPLVAEQRGDLGCVAGCAARRAFRGHTKGYTPVGALCQGGEGAGQSPAAGAGAGSGSTIASEGASRCPLVKRRMA